MQSLRHPHMTRAHFNLLAEAISLLDIPGEGRDACSSRAYVAEKVADALAGTNPRFDRGRFVRIATEGRS